MEEIKFKRIVFLNDLPRYNEGSRYKNKINWRTCIGCKVAFIYDDIEGEIKIVDYKPSTQYLYIKYMNEEVFKIKVGNFENCVLGKLLGKYTDKFKVEIGQNFIDVKHNITIIDRKKDNSYKLYKYKCNKCGFDCGEHYKNGVKYNDYWIFESNLLKGNNCICCKGLVTVKGINDIKTTAPWMVKYFYNEKEAEAYTKSSRNKIKIKCPDCGRTKDNKVSISSIYYKKSISCICSDKTSYPEKFIFSVLEQLKIDFKLQLSKSIFKWCRQYKYDFYFKLNNDQYIIEAHGNQHYKDTKMGYRHYAEEQENDKLKKELALNNGIKEENYIVIDCRKSELGWIKDNILNSELNNVFDLSNIDWLKCEEFALKNRVKEACNLKKEKYNLTAKEIGKIMKLDRKTIIRYLKKGTKLGWCDYDPKAEIRKSNSKNGKMSGKPVEVFKDDISLGIFSSCSEIERQSEELFGIKLLKDSMYLICNEKQKLSYKGFKFRYCN